MPSETLFKIADHMPLRHMPGFWDPEKAYRDYSPDIEGAYAEGIAYARKHDVEPASPAHSPAI
ncbi:hypothetical protein HYT05_05070 [Candidatus Kaiserbacteria bacterium]|nr:hypothetical protein [Candidatus Kaiserbacteria bacterium]